VQHVFISEGAIQRPDFFTIYYNAWGEHYQRIESEVNTGSFDKDSDTVRIELYANSSGGKIKPVLLKVIHRQE
jgi:hypothetical protein